MKENKLKLIFWPIIYLILILALCASGFLVFHSYYYKSIYVVGQSMSPNLHGDSLNSDFGIVDCHKKAIDNLKRFDVVTTYYPWEDYDGTYDENSKNTLSFGASYKIKRVYAFPYEEFSLDVSEDGTYSIVTIYKSSGNEHYPIPFIPNGLVKSMEKTKLYENQYWVMGDNWSTSGASLDCYSKKQPIYRGNIVGKLVAIEGHGEIKSNKLINKKYTGQFCFPFVKKENLNPDYE